MTTERQRFYLVAGGTSAMARAIGLRIAERGDGLVLAGRDLTACGRAARDIEIRSGSPCLSMVLDITDVAAMPAFLKQLEEAIHAENGELHGLILAAGTLGDEAAAQAGNTAAQQSIFASNFTGPAALLEHVAAILSARGRGEIVAIGSVAGDRGRQSNYTYGSAKGALHLFAQGLRNRLYAKGVHVLTVKPGFTHTPMTAGMALPELLTGTPESVARDVMRALERRRDVIYTGGIWRWIMFAIRCIPERVFKRMSL